MYYQDYINIKMKLQTSLGTEAQPCHYKRDGFGFHSHSGNEVFNILFPLSGIDSFLCLPYYVRDTA